jgi:chromosome segregation ATPase
MVPVESAALSREIDELERELSDLRTRADDDDSSFSALEEQIDGLRRRLSETRDAVRLREEALAQKKAEFVEAQRLEHLAAYQDELAKFREARDRLSDCAQTYLNELESYDGAMLGLRQRLAEMRVVFGDDERVAEVRSVLTEVARELGRTWAVVVSATKWRLDDSDVIEADADRLGANDQDDFFKDLQPQAPQNPALRILDYFSKT